MKKLTLPPYDPKMWFYCNSPIVQAASDPQAYGYPTTGELIASVARDRGLNPRALTKQLDAARFLMSIFPELIASQEVLGGYSQTEYLKKIFEIAPETARVLAPKVVSGQITMPKIKEAFEKAVSTKGGPSSAGAMARRRVVDFESQCARLLSEDLESLVGTRPARLTQDFHLNGYNVDFAIHDTKDVFMAIECRIGGMRSSDREAFDVVANLAMFTRRAEKACLLVPASARHLADSVNEIANKWEVGNVIIGYVTDGQNPELEFPYGALR